MTNANAYNNQRGLVHFSSDLQTEIKLESNHRCARTMKSEWQRLLLAVLENWYLAAVHCAENGCLKRSSSLSFEENILSGSQLHVCTLHSWEM